MSAMKFNAHLDTSHHGLLSPFKDAGVVEDSLTGIHNAMVKYIFEVNRGCLNNEYQVSPRGKIQRFQIWRA
jgi:hypothetical protein